MGYMDTKHDFTNAVVYESALELPTYLIKNENPNPVFHSQYGVAYIYPYTLLDHIDQHPTPKKYHTLILENRYLRVTVIPDLGGRVYSVFDKVSQRDVFYKNNVIKFSPLAIRGAFFSGGIEFSFPVAHAPTTADRVNWALRQNTDGSASVSFGGIEHISRLRWMVTLTLFPDRCALAQDVVLSNPYFLPGRFHYWTNASLEADDQTEFIYPFRRVRSYEFAGSAPWPYARLDLIHHDPGLPGMEGTPKWPVEHMHDPFNFRWQKNILTHISIFGRDVAWNFFGAWQHSKNYGYIHYADHQDVAGMKLWSWGKAPIGVVNQSALTDDGSIYAETQCGAMETQLDFDFLTPFSMKSWREWWIPLRQIQGLTCASSEIGANIRLKPIDQENAYEFLVGVCPARSLNQVSIELSTPDEVLISDHCNLTPENPRMITHPIDSRKINDKPLRIVVRDSVGNYLLEYTLDRETTNNKYEHQKSVHFAHTDSDDYQQGFYYEKLDQRDLAIQSYLKAIKKSPNHPGAHFRLGLLYLRAVDFQKASVHFQTALANNMEDANYYLALIEINQNRIDPALKYLDALPATSSLYAPAQVYQTGIKIRQQQFSDTIPVLKHIRGENINFSAIHTLLGIAYRKSGNTTNALDHLQTVIQIDPLNHIALRELAILTSKDEYRETLKRLLNDDRQYILDLVCFYIDFGLLEDALQILDDFGCDYSYPMIGYLGYWVCKTLKQDNYAEKWLQQAINGKSDYVFPSRLEEIIALITALQQNPSDLKAKYYLGNFYYARQRYDEAIQLWEEAVSGMSNFDVLFRNLGWAIWKQKNNIPLAIEYFEHALSINPLNQDLYLHLDQLYKLGDQSEKRQILLEKIKTLPNLREDVRKRSILMLVELGRHDEAIEIMHKEKFVPLEMDQTFHDVYVRAYLQRAEQYIRSGLVYKAIEDYQKALEYPINLGVGQPPDLNQAQIYYQLGLAYESIGRYIDALKAWHCAAREHHPSDSQLYSYVKNALDKINRYSELGLNNIL
jgi:tetratricopeptide (TPR) repeat protein